MLRSRFADLRRAEDSNFEASVERLGDTADLAEDFVEAYEAIFRLLRETKDPPDHLYVVSVLILAARYQLERAVLDVLRARISDGFQATRRAIELAGFAAKIGRHPHLADVWLDASKGDEAYETYRRKFSRNLFPDDDELLAHLGERYDHGSKQFHGSPFSVGGRASVTQSRGAVELEFRVFQIDDDEEAEPASSFLWILNTHLEVLQAFVRVLEEQLGRGLASWQIRESGLIGKLNIHRQKWSAAIEKRIKEKRGDPPRE